MLYRFTLFGVNVCIDYETGCKADFTRLLPSQWNAPEFTGDDQSIYIVLRSYGVTHFVPEDTFIAGGSTLVVCSNGIRIFGDGAKGTGFCSYPADNEERAEFSELVETLVLFLVAQAGRIPLHASAAIHENIAVIFAGRSGAGKSSMAFAASQAGMAVLSEDTVYIQCAPRLRVWGMPRAIHLLASRGADYGNSPLRYRGGKLKHVMPIDRTAHMAEQAILCVLAKGEDTALHPMDVDEAIDMLTRDPEPGYGFYGSRPVDAIRAITARGCWRLTLSHNSSAAITALLNAWPRIAGYTPA